MWCDYCTGAFWTVIVPVDVYCTECTGYVWSIGCQWHFRHIAIQVILNIAVVTNTIPNTGVTLPFISYGGTSILFLMAEMGIALSISRQIRVEE